MARSPYSSATWRRVRLFVLRRDGYVCRIRLSGCTDVATEADHIVSIDDGGAWYDPLNLRAACKHCNSLRGNITKQAKLRANRGDEPAGPPPLPPSREW